MIAITTTANNCHTRCNTTTCDCDFCRSDYFYYDVSTKVDNVFEDVIEMIRYENMIASQWILRHVVDWVMPIEPVLKRLRKNSRMMFCKRNIGKYSLIGILVFILLWK